MTVYVTVCKCAHHHSTLRFLIGMELPECETAMADLLKEYIRVALE